MYVCADSVMVDVFVIINIVIIVFRILDTHAWCENYLVKIRFARYDCHECVLSCFERLCLCDFRRDSFFVVVVYHQSRGGCFPRTGLGIGTQNCQGDTWKLVKVDSSQITKAIPIPTPVPPILYCKIYPNWYMNILFGCSKKCFSKLCVTLMQYRLSCNFIRKKYWWQ